MTTPLLTTKLYTPPLRRELVARPRLIQLLNAGCHRKLALISAPAGYGKTTLVSEWIPQAGRPVSWLSLDEEDNDPTRFLTYFIAAVQALEPAAGADALGALRSPQPAPIEAILTSLINDLAAISAGFVLVLDDYHLIENQAVHDAVTFILDHEATPTCPGGQCQGVQLAIVTRKDPPLPLARLRASDEVTEIRARDLRFTEREAQAFLNEKMGLNLTPEEVRALTVGTEGWIAGLHLAALSLQMRVDRSSFVQAFAGDDRYVMDYLVGEVLSQQPEAVQRFLLQTSVLERLSGPLCDAVFDNGGAPRASQDILEHLDRTNLFIVPLDNRRQWYRYHHLFADLLRHRARRRLGAQTLESLHSRASEWYEQNGLTAEALGHALAAKDIPRAADLVEQSARDMLHRSELATLMKWVDALPDNLVQARPWLCVFYAWALRLTGGGAAAVESWLRRAEQALESKTQTEAAPAPDGEPLTLDRDTHQLLGHIATLRAFQALYREDIAQTLELCRQALDHGLEDSFARSSVAFAHGWGYRFSGDLEASCQAFGEARTISQASGNTYMVVAATCRLAYSEVLAGQLRHAFASCQEALQAATQKDGRHWPVAGYALVYLGDLYRERNELETAARCLDEGIQLCRQVGYIMDQLVGWATLARVRWAQGGHEAAQEALRNVQALRQKMHPYGYARRWADETRVRMWLAQNDLAAVERWLREGSLRMDDELIFNREMEHIILARGLVGLGLADRSGPHLADGLRLLARLADMADTAGWKGKLIEILALQTLALQARGDMDQALAVLGRALALAEPEGYARIFLDEGPAMAGLLREAAMRGMASDYASRLLAAWQVPGEDVGKVAVPSTPSSTAGTASALVEPLSEREAEVLRLIAEGLSNREIAARLVLALSTVKVHTRNIYAKLDVHSRTQAIHRARDLGLL